LTCGTEVTRPHVVSKQGKKRRGLPEVKEHIKGRQYQGTVHLDSRKRRNGKTASPQRKTLQEQQRGTIKSVQRGEMGFRRYPIKERKRSELEQNKSADPRRMEDFGGSGNFCPKKEEPANPPVFTQGHLHQGNKQKD